MEVLWKYLLPLYFILTRHSMYPFGRTGEEISVFSFVLVKVSEKRERFLRVLTEIVEVR